MANDALRGIWPEWEIEKELGRGSFGVVYKAVRRDHNVESYAAIKIISIPSNESELDSLRSEGLGLDATRTYLQGIVNDFVSEIQLMESLKGIQNIVSVEDYKVVEKTGELGWDIYIRMELLTSFNSYLRGKQLTEEEVVKLGCDICSALEICSKRNIVHRDIKPENIFINDFGYFKLGDFGIARKLENVTGGLSQKGTFFYMAPEVASSNSYDTRVDTYSLGIVLYRLMNGNRLPFLGAEQQLNPNERRRAVERRLQGEPLPPPCDASPAMADVILRACAFDPARRFASATEMKQALLSVGERTCRLRADDPARAAFARPGPLSGGTSAPSGRAPSMGQTAAPQGWNPAASGQTPPPQGWNPAASGQTPPPQGWNPAASGQTPPPQGWNPAASGQTPQPQGWNPAASMGRTAAPQGWNPAASMGQTGAPQGWNPAQPGWNPSMGQTAPPPGWNPAPQGWPAAQAGQGAVQTPPVAKGKSQNGLALKVLGVLLAIVVLLSGGIVAALYLRDRDDGSDNAGVTASEDSQKDEVEEVPSRDEEIATILSEAEELAGAGDYEGAKDRVEEGLEEYPDSEALVEKADEYAGALDEQARQAAQEEQAAYELPPAPEKQSVQTKTPQATPVPAPQATPVPTPRATPAPTPRPKTSQIDPSLFLGSAQEGTTDLVMTIADVNLRTGPSTAYDKIVMVDPGTVFTCYGMDSGWFIIDYNGRILYVTSEFARYVQAEDLEYGLIGTLVMTTSVNVRTGPDTTYGIVDTLTEGRKLVYLGTSGDWYRVIYYDGTTAYVKSDYVYFDWWY